MHNPIADCFRTQISSQAVLLLVRIRFPVHGDTVPILFFHSVSLYGKGLIYEMVPSQLEDCPCNKDDGARASHRFLVGLYSPLPHLPIFRKAPLLVVHVSFAVTSTPHQHDTRRRSREINFTKCFAALSARRSYVILCQVPISLIPFCPSN